MSKLNEFAMGLIERRQERVKKLGYLPVDPLPAQVREPVLYANALLVQLQMLQQEANTQELHIIPSDLDTGNLDFEL